MKVSRVEEIKDIMLKDGQASISALCKKFGVSSVTIRHDLQSLEDQGFLKRTHGGAVLSSREKRLVNRTWFEVFPSPEKKRSIAIEAEKIIKDGMWVYLSSGVTCYELAKKLVNRKLNIVTSGLNTAMLLIENSDSVNVFLPGGIVKKHDGKDLFLSGEWFLQSISNIRVDIAFMTIAGVDLEAGLTISDSNEITLVNKIKDISDKVYLFVDSDKFDYRSFMQAASMEYPDAVITNRDIPNKYVQYFKEHNIELITD